MPRIDVHQVFMRMANEVAQLSYAKRNKVGCLIVKDGQIISMGYNGMPSGDSFGNECEINNVTKPAVLHAESNALMKLAKTTFSSNDAILYTTLSPCFECSKLIIQAGIKEIFYRELYRNPGDSFNLLGLANIKLFKVD